MTEKKGNDFAGRLVQDLQEYRNGGVAGKIGENEDGVDEHIDVVGIFDEGDDFGDEIVFPHQV